MKEKTILDCRIEKGDFDRGGEVSSRLKDLLRKLGVDPSLIRKTAIVSYELEMNVIIHSDGGQVEAKISSDNIIINVEDDGPGIEDLDQAFQPGFSTASDQIREMGFGAGMGLNNIKRCSDQLDVETEPGQGTKIRAVIYLK